MTAGTVPSNPSVLNSTVLSNFAYIDRVRLLADLKGICTVPVVQEELSTGVDDHPFLQLALNSLNDDEIPIASLTEDVTQQEKSLRGTLDAGEAQALALAEVHNGRLLTDDGDARTIAKNRGVSVVGSVGVLLAAVDAGRVSEETADEWLSIWIDEIGYYVPYRNLADYRS